MMLLRWTINRTNEHYIKIQF